MEHFSYKGGCIVHGVQVLSYLKGNELAWAIDKWLCVISNVLVMLLRN